MEISVLVIEDDVSIQEQIEVYLRKFVHTINFVNRIDLGIEKLCSKKFDLVILDLKLLDSTGNEVINFLESHPNNINYFVPIIVSSSSIDEVFKRVYGNRVSKTLPKPIEKDEFVSSVRLILDPSYELAL